MTEAVEAAIAVSGLRVSRGGQRESCTISTSRSPAVGSPACSGRAAAARRR